MLAETNAGFIDVALIGLWKVASGTRHGNVRWDDESGVPGNRYVCLGGFNLLGGRGSASIIQNCWGFFSGASLFYNSHIVALSPA